jgi:hypothetical protein
MVLFTGQYKYKEANHELQEMGSSYLAVAAQ